MGAIIAAGLSRGLRTADLIEFYTSSGRQMFDPSWLIERIKYLYTSDPLKTKLQEVFGQDTSLDPDDLKCLLLVVTKNVTTDSPWPISQPSCEVQRAREKRLQFEDSPMAVGASQYRSAGLFSP
jgi:hypothetical protein